MNNRQEDILNIIIREYVRTAAPVSSQIIAEKYKLEISPATVRNDMAELEEEGYIAQPHTSAGRIPTELAYIYYLSNLKNKKIPEREEEKFKNIFDSMDEESAKRAAKILSESSGQMVFWAINKQNLYYTGISNLLSQPEFRELNLIYSISKIIDQVEEIIRDIFEETELGRHVLVGSNNPFGNFCSSVLVKYKFEGRTGMFGILGPMRMDYEKNIGIADYILEKLKK